MQMFNNIKSWCQSCVGICAAAVFTAVGLAGVIWGIPALEQVTLGAVLICGTPIAAEATENLFQERRITSALLITLAMVACVITGETFAAGEVAFLMALGEMLEARTVSLARRGVAELADLMPVVVHLLHSDGSTTDTEADNVRPGDILRVLPGETIPVDGQVVSGESSVNQALMTGESLPVEKQPGDDVFSGTLNTDGCLHIRAVREAQDSALCRLIDLAQEATRHRAPTQRLADKWASALVPISLLLGILIYLFTGDIQRGVTVLVVFCPCALALATPTSVVAAIGQASRNGVLIKSGAALERLAGTTCFAFDKTGTLTQGKLSVQSILPAPGVTEKELLSLAAAAEQYSEHPIATAVMKHAATCGITPQQGENARAVPGQGICARVDGRLIHCGSPAYLHNQGCSLPGNLRAEVDALRKQGHACLAVAADDMSLGIIAVADTLRHSEAPAAAAALRQLGMHLALITGDHPEAAARVAQSTGITDITAEAMPADKLKTIERLHGDGHTVCMVGDGINDAPALRRADVGIAMGCASNATTQDSADIILIHNDLTRLPYLLRLAKACFRTIRFNISASLFINAVAIVLSAGGLLTPISGAVVHNAGSLLIILNAALLYKRRFRTAEQVELTP